MKVGLIGCGAIGSTLAQSIKRGEAGNTELIGICDEDKKIVTKLFHNLELEELVKTTNPEELIGIGEIELIIEAASQEAVKSFAEKVLKAKKNLMILSVGALSDNSLLMKLKNLAKENAVTVYIPSGAISGLDGVKAGSIESIESVQLISTKNPKSLVGQPYLLENEIDLSELKEPKVVFNGNAKDAAIGFPKSVNIAVALSLAGIGVEKTKVTLIADPDAKKTKHEIFVKGSFGDMYSRVENILHPENPRTSYLAALAAIRSLRNLTEPIHVGT